MMNTHSADPHGTTRVIAAASLTVALLLTGCTSDEQESATPPPSIPSADDEAPTPAEEDSLATLGEPTELTTDLVSPWGLTFLPDGSALVSERITGEIQRIPADGGDAQTVGVVPDVDVSSEGGLLGIVASEDFDEDRTVFASVSGAD